jgi:G3E family GTPase
MNKLKRTRLKKIPVSLIAGFLGAGKTTLLNRILNEHHGLRIGVLVNDFGAISIDTQLITNIEGETISLANGCVCCTIRDDLVNAILQLIAIDTPPDYIITETSGVSDPESAAMALVMSTKIAAKISLDSIITVVDAEQVLELDSINEKLAIDQIEVADIVVINKTDLVSEKQLQQVHRWLENTSPQARMIEATYGQVPMELIFGVGEVLSVSGNKTKLATRHEHPEHGDTFSSYTWTSDQPLAFQKIYHAFKTLPLSIFRAKGILQLGEVEDKRVILQMVGKRVTLAKGDPWGDKEPASQIVVIGSRGTIDEQELSDLFDSCLATDDTGKENRLADAVIEILRLP